MNSREQPSLNLSEIYDEYVAQKYASITVEGVVQAILAEGEDVEIWKHPLGFAHAELTSPAGVPSGERFRLHFWLDGSRGSDQLGDLHEHTWHLTSLVLEGEVVDTNLVASAAREGTYLGSRISYGDTNVAQKVGRFNLEMRQVRTISKGNVYRIPSRIIHLNEVTIFPTVTLVRSVDDGRGDGPLVLTKYDQGQGVATSRRERIPTVDSLGQLSAALNRGQPSRTSTL